MAYDPNYDPPEPEPADVSPDGITFTIDPARLIVGARYDGPVHLVDLVIERAANILVKQADADTRSNLRKMAQDMLMTQTREQAVALVAEALRTDVQDTDSYGFTKGKPRPLGAVVIEEAKRYINQGGDNYNRGNPPLKKLIADEVERRWDTELANELKAAKAEIRAAVHRVAAEKLGDIVTAALGAR